MHLHNLVVFLIAYLLATAAPGPAVAAVLARVLSHGRRGIPSFIAGFVVGDLIWFLSAAMGMAAIAQTAHNLFVVLKYAGVAYLLYLAFRSFTTSTSSISIQESQDIGERPLRLFFGSVALTLSNPKAMIFFLALLPTVVNLARLGPIDILRLGVAICLILSSVLGLYVVVALRARLLFQSSRAVLWLNRGTGVVMTGAAIAVASR